MANYLPVLLVSLTNSIPDDSSVTTAPRAQVDYLSHDWQEEDVWRSWRNMTRQKNAIANGARLENASWRTWWKQRNKLGTVSPETLNWLKDSDVTWLYGPLHTAVEWKPPPRQQSTLSNSTTALARSNSPYSNQPYRSNAVSPYKPILKHRSISELLTSDLPVTSPIFSPIDSGEESEITDINSRDGSIPLNSSLKRPPLLHTKSDTLVTSWGSSRTFRKGSPSRIDSPEAPNGSQRPASHLRSTGGAVRASHSQDSNSSEKSATSGSDYSQTRHKKKHISFNTFVEQCIAIDKPKKNASGYFGAIPETSWMGARTWVDETGYEEDQEDSEEEEKVFKHCSQWIPESGGARAIREDSDSPGEEDDDDDDDDAIEIRSTSSRSTSTLRPNEKSLPRSQSKVSTTSSSSSASTSTTSSSRSHASTHSTTDNTSSPSGSLSPDRRISSSSSIPRKYSTSSLAGSRHVYRRSSTTMLTSTYRPSFHRIPRPVPSRSPLENNRPQHVTIAPIAPTLLKTTPTSSWAESFGDDGAASSEDIFAGWAWGVGGKIGVGDRADDRDDRERHGGSQRRNSWTIGYGADCYGFSPGSFRTGRDGRGMGFGVAHGAGDRDGHSSDGTPVELVYVPPYEYDFPDEPDVGFDDVEGSQVEEVRETAHIEKVEDIAAPGANLEKVFHHVPRGGNVVPSSSTSAPMDLHSRLNIPTVIVDEGPSSSIRDKQRVHPPTVEDEELERDPYDYFGGPDMGDDYYYYSRRGGYGNEYATAGAVPSRGRPSDASPRTSHATDRRHLTRELERNSRGNGEERQSRSRSRSQSRTPSPALLSASPTKGESGADCGRQKSVSSSAVNGLLSASSPRSFSQSDLLSLPARGRQRDTHSRSFPLQHDERRGRSATRASSSSSSWGRERGSSGSLSSPSPIGPDGYDGRRSVGPGVGSPLGAVLGGGRVEKEKDRQFETGRERRGRERTSSRALGVVSSPADQSVVVSNMDASFASASSSSSSNTSTIVPKQGPLTNEKEDPELVHMRLAEEMLSKNAAPTPTNSPVLTLSSLGNTSRNGIVPTMSSGADLGGTPTPPTSDGLISTPLSSPTRSSSKFRPPLALKPASPSPAKPSTSFAAVVSPTVSSSPPLTTPITSASAESTIVGKAVDIVSSAGMYLGLWGRERSGSAPSSPP